MQEGEVRSILCANVSRRWQLPYRDLTTQSTVWGTDPNPPPICSPGGQLAAISTQGGQVVSVNKEWSVGVEAVFGKHSLSLLDRGQAPEQSSYPEQWLTHGTGPPWPGNQVVQAWLVPGTPPGHEVGTLSLGLLMPPGHSEGSQGLSFSPYHNFRGEEKVIICDFRLSLPLSLSTRAWFYLHASFYSF